MINLSLIFLRLDIHTHGSFSVSVSNIHRYDPNADFPMDIETEQDRVIFIKSVAQFMVSNTTIVQAIYTEFTTSIWLLIHQLKVRRAHKLLDLKIFEKCLCTHGKK